MAPVTFWKGYLKLSLVTCPVAMASAVSESEKVRFHTLNKKTGHRVQSRYIDSQTHEPVERDDQIKGYAVGADDYVTLEDSDLEAVALESTNTIDLQTFVPKDSIDWIWYDRPHYLLPDDPVGEEAFSVIRDAMVETGLVAISRLVLYRRERAVMLEPRDRGLVLWTLRYGDEVRDAGAYFDEIKDVKLDAKLFSLVTTLIGERTKEWDPAIVHDPVQEKLREMIAAKAANRPLPKAKPEQEPSGNVVSIMDALRKSIAEEKRAPNGHAKKR
ncbi:MAG: Ku protein [Methylovirgula sp.]|jgi:DNA end-binding protein Ku